MRAIKKIFPVMMMFVFLLAMGALNPCLATDGEVLVTEVDIKPETLNLKISHGKSVITCFVEAPEGYEAEEIIADSVIISEVRGVMTVGTTIEPVRSNIKDDDEDGVNELMLKYSRSELQEVLKSNNLTGQVEITVTGSLTDTETFTGSDTVRVRGPRK